MKRYGWIVLLGVCAMVVLVALTASAAEQRSAQSAPRGRNFAAERILSYFVPSSASSAMTVPSPRAQETIDVFVELSQPTLAEIWLAVSRNSASAADMERHAQALSAAQSAAAGEIEQLDGRVLANYSNVFNGLAVQIASGDLAKLWAVPGVVSVEAVVDYQVTLNNTVPWIGAAAVHSDGFDGSGVRVAVVDTGIDYTHGHLGGSGEQADTNKALAEASVAADPALYPTSKVIGGYDFIGSSWDGINNTVLAPDPNPMDDNGGFPGGHGTHVASIVAGVDAGGAAGPGVAPGASLYALKVCSSISTSCSAIATRQAFDWAADPDGDLDFSDRADVLNLSLGSSYGQTGDQDLAILDQLSALGMITVAAAGNGGDQPYVLSSPARADTVISVAQTSQPAPLFESGEALAGRTDQTFFDSMVVTSSRGPTFDTNSLKPEIGAPGASLSAVSGNQSYAPFGGTSGSTPMIAGSVALLLEANGGSGSLDWKAAKALLMNNAVVDVADGQTSMQAAAISRQGAGRVDVHAAAGREVLAYEVENGQAALSFGLAAVSGPYSASKQVMVQNNSAVPKQFNIAAELRFDEDKNYGISIEAVPDMITVAPGESQTFEVLLQAAGPQTLPSYNELLAGGGNLNSGDKLTTVEVDGFVTLTGSEETLRLPFHFLPRRSAALSVDQTDLSVPVAPEIGSVEINNGSAVSGLVEAYPLFDISPPIDTSSTTGDIQPVDLQYVGSDVVIDPFDGDEQYDDHNVYLFAISTYENRSHPVNVRHLVYVDLDQDGQDDWIVYNAMRSDGVWLSTQFDVHTSELFTYFLLDTALNSNNMVLYLLLPETADPDLDYRFRVEANDAYFGLPDGAIRKWDESPLGGGYHRHIVLEPKFVTDTYIVEIAPMGSVMPRFQSKLSESTQIGYMYRFYDGDLETTAVHMQVAGYRQSLLPVVSAADTSSAANNS